MRALPLLCCLFAASLPVASAAENEAAAAQLAEGLKLARSFLEGHAEEAIPVYEEALKAGADEFTVRWREADAYFWAGEALDLDKDGKKLEQLGLKCIDAAQKAAALQPDRVEGNYYLAVCYGEYSHGISIPKALLKGVEGKFKAAAAKAEKADPTFLDGAPLNAWGRLYYELPWPKRDLSKSAEYLKRNIEATPCNLRTRFYYAETLLKKGGKVGDRDAKDLAKEELQFVLDHDHCADNPEDGELAKRKAKIVLGKL